ncbi:hypothetical protein [Jeongeupia naejangsanensis]|uniref:Transposase n=1 Tax=Jeongeupia naejangsanensis TaxID=613195 RepID=A0ABS2BJB3_9NEIS|nr:hypothetical protein [Jeongeupia naejangsanensis]MBM3115691.1 hypothetical protein [Jeongeupia naejangsanensis]
MVYEEKQPVDGLHMQLGVRKDERRKPATTTAGKPPVAHRIDVDLQKPFDPEASDLYDPDRPPDDDIAR